MDITGWITGENLFAIGALIISGAALFYSRSSVKHAKRSADAAEDANRASWQSAIASSLSAEATRESVGIQRAQWMESKSALLRVANTLADDELGDLTAAWPTHVTILLENVGKAAAVDMYAFITIGDKPRTEAHRTKSLPPGKKAYIEVPIHEKSEELFLAITLEVRYQDYEKHHMFLHFRLRRRTGDMIEQLSFPVPRLEAANLDRKRHPGHLDIPALPPTA